MLRLITQSIQARYLLVLIVFAIVPAFVIGGLAWTSARTTIESRVRAQLTSVSDLEKQQISSWLASRESDVTLLADNFLNEEHLTVILDPDADPEIQDAFAGFITQNLNSIQANRSGYDEIAFLSRTGRVVLSTEAENVGKDYGDLRVFRETLGSESGQATIDIHRAGGSGDIEMAFGHVMQRVDLETTEVLPEVNGVAIIRVNMDETIFPLISAWAETRETAEMLLVRREGDDTRFLNPLRFGAEPPLGLRVPRDSETAEPSHLASSGEEGIIETVDYRGVSVLAAYRYIPGINWGFVAKEDLSQAFAPIERLTRQLAVVTLVVLLIAVVVAIGSARRLTGSLRRLALAAEAVEQGDLDTEISIGGKDEVAQLAGSFNSMVGGLKERNRLEIENSVIDARDQENRKYLDNIAEGLVLIDRDYRISDQYSRYVETLFATSNVAGRSFAEFIYPDESAQQEYQELEQFLGMIFENTSTEMEMIMSINPLSEKKVTVGTGDNQREVIFGANFQRVMGDDGSVERVMAIFEDRTDIVHTKQELESERERYKSDIEHIATLLKTGPDSYSEFESSALETIAAVEGAVQELPTGDARNTLLRDLHSLKGTARYLEFFSIADLANRAESLLEESSLGELSQVVAQMREEMESLGRINEKFRAFAGSISEEDSGRAALENFLEHIEKMTHEIAGELEKDVALKIENELNELPNLSKLQNPIIHLIRNAIDHGIEDQYQRLTAGKEGTAQISLALNESATAYTISIADDGAGIDFDAVRRIGIEKGVLQSDQEYSEKELIKTLFAPSFSTRTEITDVSGRGVGLDAVHEEVRALDGKIGMGTRRGAGTRFTVTIPKATTE